MIFFVFSDDLVTVCQTFERRKLWLGGGGGGEHCVGMQSVMFHINTAGMGFFVPDVLISLGW